MFNFTPDSRNWQSIKLTLVTSYVKQAVFDYTRYESQYKSHKLCQVVPFKNNAAVNVMFGGELPLLGGGLWEVYLIS